jgi:hypothetical protein
VATDPVEEFRVSGVLRGTAQLGQDPALEAAAELLRKVAQRRDLGPAADLPLVVQSLWPILGSRAHGFRLTPRSIPGDGLRVGGSLTYFWWTPGAGVGTPYEECRLAAKLGYTREQRCLRGGVQVRARSREVPAMARLLPSPLTGWWSPKDLGKVRMQAPWRAVRSRGIAG